MGYFVWGLVFFWQGRGEEGHEDTVAGLATMFRDRKP